MTDSGPAEAPGGAPRPAAVLVVNDREGQRVAIGAMLAPLGLVVVEASSGRDALRAVLRETFALILMDVRMPTMDGYETAKLIRQRSQTASTPIIFVTAFGRDDTETLTAYASGAVDFIFTPVLPDVLRAKVSFFVELFVQSQELKRSLESITTLNAALRDSEAGTQAVLDNVADGIVTVSEGGLIESLNRSARALFGYSQDDVNGQPLAFVLAPDSRAAFRGFGTVPREQLAEGGRRSRATETLGQRRDGSTFPMEVEHGEIKLDDQVLTLAFVRDISERKAYTEGLEHQALHDSLTGLANRTLFGEHVLRAIASAKRTNEPRAVLVMDLDGFKQVNDTLGHDQGDALLKQVGERLVAALRETDTIARLGGDEFAILPGDATDLAAAAAIALKIQRTCAAGFKVNGEVVHVSASIGIALYPEHGKTTAELLRRADVAMYVAKRSGSGHAMCDEAQEKQTAHQLALLIDLRLCIAREELVLHYQPKIDLESREIYGVEALLRWRHPVQGLLQPDSFMPEVERTELIGPVTRWVLNEALRQQRTWRDEGVDLTMAVNISARSLGPSSDLPDTVAELTEIWETPPDRLTLELTEGALVEAAAPGILARLHDMGQSLSIDDFGTGYSSLAYLQRLPVDELKIDRSFVMGLSAASDDAVIVRSTIELAHNLGLSVVAEGVEGELSMDVLVAYGCDSAQGYFFSRPCPAEELGAWLTESPFGACLGRDRRPATIGQAPPMLTRTRRAGERTVVGPRPARDAAA
jgi:diguanylate cyclase (GGDEF)-like protein/PAS domain S-box-containing protein